MNPRSTIEMDTIAAPRVGAVAADPERFCLEAFVRGHTPQIVIVLAILSALRIFVLVMAFPLSNEVDERYQLETIKMYAHGHLPDKALPHLDPESSRTLLLYWSPESGMTGQQMARIGVVGPLYGLSPEGREAALDRDYYRNKLAQWSRRPNYEAQSAPLYYLVAAGWYRLGSLLGMHDWLLDYWIRFLNPILFGLLVWTSYLFVRTVYPDRTFLKVAVPGLIAVIPQAIFYGVNRDVLSAPMSAAALLLLIEGVDNNERYRSLLIGSLIVGLAFLSSVSNFVLYGPLLMSLYLWARRSSRSLREKATIALAAIGSSCLLPSLWMLRNYLVMGDLTGGRAKTRDLGWTIKPLGEVLQHPLFTWRGLSYFVSALTRSFWRGEYTWRGSDMRSGLADAFYVASSILFAFVFVVAFVRKRQGLAFLEKVVGLQWLFLCASSGLFLAVISLLFDFHDCAYPSRAYPYFVSGRIISGVMLPFAIIYVSGLELATGVFRRWVSPLAVLACLMLAITTSEISVRSVVFSSPYNFFALAGWRH